MKASKKIPISKILTIESYDEDATRQLMHTLYKSPEFKDYKIDHFYCQTPHEETFDKEALFQRLKKKINDFEPQIILIHTGVFFFCNQQTFELLLSKIKTQYPGILLGIQNRTFVGQNSKILDSLDETEEIIRLEKLIFKIMR